MVRHVKLATSMLGLVGLSVLGACSASDRDASPAPPPEASAPATPVSVQVAERDSRTGAPTFAWLRVRESAAALPRRSALEAAWGALRGAAPAYGLATASVAAARLMEMHDTGVGPVIARFSQTVNGVEVFQSQVNVGLTRDMNPYVATGTFAPEVSVAKGSAFRLEAPTAVASAYRAFTGRDLDGATLAVVDADDNYTSFAFRAPGGPRMDDPARVKRVYFPGAKGLEAAYYVELSVVGAGEDGLAELRSFVISATDGATLFSHTLTHAEASAFTYRVYAETQEGPYKARPFDGPQGLAGTPHPTGALTGYQPPFVPDALLTLPYAPGFSRQDPWLPPGATVTTGNNVDAFANLVAPDGFGTGDVRPTISSANTFDYHFDPKKIAGSTPEQVNAAAVQLFYTLNYLHDWFYDAGWDEKSFNPQRDNYGRGGAGNDAIRAQALDVSGRNNANASTPADGASPRIRMYIFDGEAPSSLTAKAGTSSTKLTDVGTAAFGPKTFNFTGDLVLGNDGTAGAPPATGGAAGTPTDACEAFPQPELLRGKVVLVDRGFCPFALKADNVQAAGAAGMIVANNQAGRLASMPGTPQRPVTMPILSVTQEQGQALKTQAAGGPVQVTLQRDLAIDRDGSFDGAIVAHEWGHILSNRLVGNASGLSTQQAGGMGEGWSDFVALLMMVRPEDKDDPANANWTGAYAVGGYVNGSEVGTSNQGYYYGVRRYPYSTDVRRNPLSFKLVEDGNRLPDIADGVPPAFGKEGTNNSAVHSTGEVWASMLWECFVALLRDESRLTFEEAHLRMRQYLVTSLKLTPSAPTILEARDAVLAAAYARDKRDFELFAEAFARRGAGVGAVGPAKDSVGNKGVTESRANGGAFAIEGARIDGTASECNRQAVLRNGEPGTVTFTVRNTGTRTLSAPRVAVTSTDATVQLPADATQLAALEPFAQVKVTVPVSLKGAEPLAPVSVQVKVEDPSAAEGFQTAALPIAGVYNYDVAEFSSLTDRFETPRSVWTAEGNDALAGKGRARLVPNGDRQAWVIPNGGSYADESLVSPYIGAASKGNLVLTVQHRYSFEASEVNIPAEAGGGRRMAYFDGGVVEVSTDGRTWKDVGATVAGYGVTLEEDPQNPLSKRQAFGGKSKGYDQGEIETLRLDLGSAYAGQTLRVRFRVGADGGVGAPGWEIREVSVEGTATKPFPSRAPVNAACGSVTSTPPPPAPPVDVPPPAPTDGETPAPQDPPKDSGGCATAPASSGSPWAPLALVSALAAVVLGRRRRR